MAKPYQHHQIVVEDDDDDDDPDEFEPLFDYGRVWQPPVKDDNDDDDLAMFDCKPCMQPTRKIDMANVEPEANLKSSHHESQKHNQYLIEDDDWLPPPPKRSKDEKSLVDPTILQLRQKRAELQSLMGDTVKIQSKSAASINFAVALTGKEEIQSNPDVSESASAMQTVGKGEKVVVSVQNKNGVCKSFRIFMGDKFSKLFKAYAQSVGSVVDTLVFSFDGNQIRGDSTPEELGIEDEDIVEVDVRM